MSGKHLLNPWRLMLLSLFFIGAAVAFTSCGDDEPTNEVIDYYVNVEEEFLVDGSTLHTDRYYNPVKRMQEAIRKAYPTPNAVGDDDAVIAACDKEHGEYVSLYDGGSEHMTCLMHVVKVFKRGGIVKQSETLMTYVYDINSTEIVE